MLAVRPLWAQLACDTAFVVEDHFTTHWLPRFACMQQVLPPNTAFTHSCTCCFDVPARQVRPIDFNLDRVKAALERFKLSEAGSLLLAAGGSMECSRKLMEGQLPAVAANSTTALLMTDMQHAMDEDFLRCVSDHNESLTAGTCESHLLLLGHTHFVTSSQIA